MVLPLFPPAFLICLRVFYLAAALFILSLDKHFPEEQSEEVAHAAGEDGVRQGQRGPVEKGQLIQSKMTK